MGLACPHVQLVRYGASGKIDARGFVNVARSVVHEVQVLPQRPIKPSTGARVRPTMVLPSTQLRSLLLAEAERARIAVAADVAAVSRWDRAEDAMYTLVNVGSLLPGDERFPESERYPLDSFPAMAALLREGRPYLNPDDVSSVAVAAHHRYGSHAAVAIEVDGERWGELWVARDVGQDPLHGGHVDQLHLVADRLGDALAAHA
jgi:GAF domain-containing protein